MLHRVSNIAVVHNTGGVVSGNPFAYTFTEHPLFLCHQVWRRAGTERECWAWPAEPFRSVTWVKGYQGECRRSPHCRHLEVKRSFSPKIDFLYNTPGTFCGEPLGLLFFSTLDICSLRSHFTDCGTGSNGTAAQWRKISYVLTLRRLKSLCLSLFIWMYNKISGTDSALTGLRSNQVGQISHTAAISALKTSSDEIFGDGHEGLLCMTSDCWHFNLTFHTGANENIHCMVMKWYKVIKLKWFKYLIY